MANEGLLNEALDLAQHGGHPPTMAAMIERLVKYVGEVHSQLTYEREQHKRMSDADGTVRLEALETLEHRTQQLEDLSGVLAATRAQLDEVREEARSARAAAEKFREDAAQYDKERKAYYDAFTLAQEDRQRLKEANDSLRNVVTVHRDLLGAGFGQDTRQMIEALVEMKRDQPHIKHKAALDERMAIAAWVAEQEDQDGCGEAIVRGIREGAWSKQRADHGGGMAGHDEDLP